MKAKIAYYIKSIIDSPVGIVPVVIAKNIITGSNISGKMAASTCTCYSSCGSNFSLEKKCSCYSSCGSNFSKRQKCSCYTGCGSNYSME